MTIVASSATTTQTVTTRRRNANAASSDSQGRRIAGMEAAWVAAARGHDVTVFGASDAIGGKAWLREQLPGGETVSSIYDYQTFAAKRAGVIRP